MRRTRLRLLTACLSLLTPLVAGAQEPPRALTARELFYTPVPADSKPAAVRPETATVKPTRRPPTRPASSGASGSGLSESGPSGKPEVVEVAMGRTSPQAAAASPALQTEGVNFIKSAYAPPKGLPLGLRYTLLKRVGDSEYEEADADAKFYSGDQLKVRLESNDDAYLYVVAKGSSNTWKVLFPNEETSQGSNRIKARKSYDMPGGAVFTMDNQPGTERMFIVLSRQPEKDLDNLIYEVGGDGKAEDAKPASPARVKQLTIASNQPSIDDAVLSRIRAGLISRDLVFEKVNDSGPLTTNGGNRPKLTEKAAYVVNPSDSPDARLIVDLRLEHR